MKKPRRILAGLKTYDHAVEPAGLACCVGAPGAFLMSADN